MVAWVEKKSINSRARKTDFFEMVYEVVLCIPKGRVTSYGAIAEFLGSAKSARMVGWAMNKAPSYSSKNGRRKRVPAHRVVNRRGQLTGRIYFGHPQLMQKLLESEGIKVKNNKVVNFQKHFWDPVKELHL